MSRHPAIVWIPATLVGAACFLYHGSLAIPAMLPVGVSLISLVRRPGTLDTIGQIIVFLFTVAFSYVFYFTVQDPAEMTHPRSLGAISQMISLIFLMTVSLRLHMVNPLYSHTGTAALLFCLWLSLATAPMGLSYTMFAIPGLFLVILGYLGAKGELFLPSRVSVSKRWLNRAAFVLAGLITATLLIGQPFLYRMALARFERYMQQYQESLWVSQSGFNSVIRLGAFRDMLVSNQVVMRVRPSTEDTYLLRGVVYGSYGLGLWSVPRHNRIEEWDAEPFPAPSGSVEIRYLRSDASRYFLPLEAGVLHAEEDTVKVDEDGIVKPVGRAKPSVIRFVPGDTFAYPIRPPQIENELVPDPIRPSLLALAQQWTHGFHTPEEQIHALMNRLQQDYAYALSFHRETRQDPIVEFLYQQKQGHCEYFATALALLARTLNIPTRVVGGYLMNEYNPLGQYYIVRQRHAHAWVEVWLADRGWVIFDPTPPAALLRSPSQISLLMDLVPFTFDRGLAFLANLTGVQLMLIVSGFVLLWILFRIVRRFRRHRTIETISPGYRSPAEAFIEMYARLSRRGLIRKPAEPLEDYTRRLNELGDPGEEAAALLGEYAAWRYGHLGDIDHLSSRMRRWSSRNSGPSIGE